MSGNRGDNERPIIVKKVKKAGHGHHGGAWKVAYADLVTAMMAFFLLLWLLSAASEEQKRGIAEYFTPASVSLSSGGAGGMLGGLALSPGASATASSPPVIVEMAALPPPQPSKVVEKSAEKSADEEEKERFRAMQEQAAFDEASKDLKRAIIEDPEIKDLINNVVIDMTPEGMRIQLVDKDGGAMFASGSAQLPQKTRQLLGKVAKVIDKLPNKVSISGHTDAQPFARGAYTNWELSSDRANASRRVLVDSGVTDDRVTRVAGKAATEPLNEEDPFKPENRRIGIVLVRGAPVLPPELQKTR